MEASALQESHVRCSDAPANKPHVLKTAAHMSLAQRTLDGLSCGDVAPRHLSLRSRPFEGFFSVCKINECVKLRAEIGDGSPTSGGDRGRRGGTENQTCRCSERTFTVRQIRLYYSSIRCRNYRWDCTMNSRRSEQIFIKTFNFMEAQKYKKEGLHVLRMIQVTNVFAFVRTADAIVQFIYILRK